MAIVTVNVNQIRFTKANAEKTAVLLKKGVYEIDDADLNHPYFKALIDGGAVTEGGKISEDGSEITPAPPFPAVAAPGVKMTIDVAAPDVPAAVEGGQGEAPAPDAPAGKKAKK